MTVHRHVGVQLLQWRNLLKADTFCSLVEAVFAGGESWLVPQRKSEWGVSCSGHKWWLVTSCNGLGEARVEVTKRVEWWLCKFILSAQLRCIGTSMDPPASPACATLLSFLLEAVRKPSYTPSTSIINTHSSTCTHTCMLCTGTANSTNQIRQLSKPENLTHWQ